jgi:hypothetical protein
VRPGTHRFPPDLLWRGVTFRGGGNVRSYSKDLGVRDIPSNALPSSCSKFHNSPNLGGENRAG